MKRNKVLSFLVFVFMIFMFVSCTMVEPGYEGIKVVKSGGNKGVQNAPIQTGRVWFNPFTTDVVEYPIFTQMVTWTKASTEGSTNDDSISFQSAESTTMNADISFAYRIKSGFAGKIFMKYKCDDIEDLTWKNMRSWVRDAITLAAPGYSTIDIMGTKKAEVLNRAIEILNSRLNDDGFEIDTLAFVGEIRVDANIEKSINNVIQSTQDAIAAENRVKVSTAEANQAIEAAKGDLEVAKMKAEANRILQQSLTEAFLRYKAIEKWDGVMPKVSGSTGMPLIDIK